jgi:hypothetical protein
MEEVIVQFIAKAIVMSRVRQVGLLSTVGVDYWGGLSLVREDRDEWTSGLPAVLPKASSGSYVQFW